MTRAEHLKWAKERALKYAPEGQAGDAGLAMSSLIQDFGLHPDTERTTEVVTELMMPLAMIGTFEHPGELRKFIEGFQ